MDYEVLKENNTAKIAGTICEQPTVSHQIDGENFLDFAVRVQRLSKAEDIIPVTISERAIGEEIKLGDRVILTGQYRSHNKNINDKNRLILHFFAKDVEKDEKSEEINYVKLVGFICKKPVYRTTPFNREICDVLLAVNRINYHRSDYIPCILWGRNARFVSTLPVGTKLELEGRIQSRKYTKQNENGESEEKTAYEVSCGRVAILSNDLVKKEVENEIM